MDENPYSAPGANDEARRCWLRRPVALSLVGGVVVAYFALLLPLVGLGRAHAAWIVVPILIVGIGFAAYHLPDACAEREYKAKLEERPPVDDADLFARYFRPDGMAEYIPGKVRRIFAKEMCFPAEKMLPDDDLTFYWNEIDAIDVARECEKQFGIEISRSDGKLWDGTIRGMAEMVHSKRQATSVARIVMSGG